MFENKNRGFIFSPETNLAKLIAELVYRIRNVFNIVYFIWYKRSLKLLETFLESPGKVLVFHTQLTVATLVWKLSTKPRLQVIVRGNWSVIRKWFETLFMSARSKNHTLKGGMSPYRLCMGVPPPPPPPKVCNGCNVRPVVHFYCIL